MRTTFARIGALALVAVLTSLTACTSSSGAKHASTHATAPTAGAASSSAVTAGLGAPINITAVTRFNLQYGSGLFWHDAATRGGTTAAELVQRRWLETHSIFLPPGVLGYDLAIDDRQQFTNARALNTLTTGGILFHVDFSGAQSASAYAVLGTESLVYVT